MKRRQILILVVGCFACNIACWASNIKTTTRTHETFLPPPTNENSANATTLAHNVGCSANAAYTTTGATADGARPTKWGTGPTNNVWFKFQATTTSMSVDLKTGTPEGTMKRPRLSLHNSSLTE